jgi:ribosomal protein S18 acetylase RimI-like enzyme
VLYRPYAPQDFDRLYLLEEACFEPPFRFGRGYMRQLVNRANVATWIAEEADQMAGIAILEWTVARRGIRAYLQTLEVAPEARGRGVGRELLCHLEGSAASVGAQMIWLHVDAENSTAVRLYERQGYHYAGRREDYYPLGRAALVYGKRLKAEATG